MNNSIFLTKSGLKKLQEELEDLKGRGRKEVAERLKEAISYGDLSENAEYDEAKNQQAFIEARIAEIEEQVKNAQLIKDSNTVSDTVQLGSKVSILEVDTKTSHEYSIVGATEADVISHKISHESPLGMSIFGKKKDEVVTVEAPGGTYQYKITKVA